MIRDLRRKAALVVIVVLSLSTVVFAQFSSDLVNRPDGMGADVSRPSMGADVSWPSMGADVSRGADGADVNRPDMGADVNRPSMGADVNRP